MQHHHTDILVIGGGATGTCVLRDLSMRGFQCLLVERRDLAYGTTGRYHGLLHSGARYAVKDPKSAQECFEENQILRHIMPLCIEDTGGFFVLTTHDDPAYVSQFLAGCRTAGIPVDEVSIPQMLIVEPSLDPSIQACFRVPDASADSFLAAILTAESAREHGAQVLTYHEVDHLILSPKDPSGQSRVGGAVCHDLIKDETVQIDASLVINASGAWAGKIADTIGIQLLMVPGKGTMLALNHRVVNTVISRCRPPSDADILVPTHTVAVMGTTDIRVADPDLLSIEPWEIRLMLDEGEKIIPSFKQYRILRAWAGVRPLIQGADASDDRDISRAFVVLDHSERDGVDGLLTISGGKWTTSRKMAQVTVDRVCQKLGVNRQCRTHLEMLPSQGKKSIIHPSLGDHLQHIEHTSTYGELICECELATVSDVEQSIIVHDAATLDDIRRQTRLGMGPCQGAFCTFRAIGMLHSLRHTDVSQVNVSMRDFLQERWKGNLPILAAQQLRQARFNELLYVNVLNTPALPGKQSSRLAGERYLTPEITDSTALPTEFSPKIMPSPAIKPVKNDVIVIGAGFSGLFTAWQAGLQGLKTTVISQGWGTPYWTSGCIDILGFQPPEHINHIDSPREGLDWLFISLPNHPYTIAGINALENALVSIKSLCDASNYPLHGSLDANILLPTSLGTLRPTCIVPATMVAGDASKRNPMLIVGFDCFYDFFPEFIASNLSAQGILSTAVSLDLTSLRKRKFLTGMNLANLFDNPDFRQEVIDALKPKLGKVERVGFPAVLGLHRTSEVMEHLQSSLGIPVFEIPGLPPSVPGTRMQNLLIAAIQRQHGAVYTGMPVIKVEADGNSIHTIWSKSAARQLSHTAKTYILATGGILGGGISVRNLGYAQESVFYLPLVTPEHRSDWFRADFLAAQGHPIFRTGVRVDVNFHPIDMAGNAQYSNLYVVGSALANCDPIHERSLEGIAFASGMRAAQLIAPGNPI
jgi:glycerol-3-phosphate dehydrogenase